MFCNMEVLLISLERGIYYASFIKNNYEFKVETFDRHAIIKIALQILFQTLNIQT